MTVAPAPFRDLTRLLSPRSIAVVGASDRAGNLGGDTVQRLRKFGFPGPVWPVNPNAQTVGGLPCFARVEDLPAAPDLAIFALPAAALLESIAAFAARGTRAGVAYAGGFAEAGGEGVELQRRLQALCRDNEFMLCGPNCVGLMNMGVPVTSTFSTVLYELDSLKPGGISFLSQSGGLATTAMSIAHRAGFGFRHLISGGNEAVVTFSDYLHALALDEGTRVIAGYLEGVSDPPRLLKALEEARRRDKPVVLVKSGSTGASARAAMAHTGSLVGEDRVVDAVLQEMGVVRAASVEEMVDVALMLASLGPAQRPRGTNVGIVTFGGGNGVLAADQAASAGLTVPALKPDTIASLKRHLVSVATASNPMDLTPSTAFRPEALAELPKALDVLAADPDLDSLLFIVSGLAAKAKEITQLIVQLWRRSPKPVCVSWPSPPIGAMAALAEAGIPAFEEPARGLVALGRIVRRGEALRRPARELGASRRDVDWARLVPAAGAGTVVCEDRCHEILRAAGLAAAEGALARDAVAAVRIAGEIGYPVVLKGISPKVTHRAAAGLLAADLRNGAELEAAFARLSARAREIGVGLDGLLVQRMRKGGFELLVAASVDPLYGPMVSVGAGGGLTELVDDVVIARAPVGAAHASDMIDRLRSRRHAKDPDGPLPTAPAAEFVAAFSALAVTAPWKRFVFEVNPIKWTRDGAVAVDGLLIVDEA
ncbi:MAG: acetate--CoA ligase family protein [Alphaproteobacteria bacterium]|nr:acetate--CoA ligase family protein [Alphaproteobacteria bacterium]